MAKEDYQHLFDDVDLPTPCVIATILSVAIWTVLILLWIALFIGKMAGCTDPIRTEKTLHRIHYTFEQYESIGVCTNTSAETITQITRTDDNTVHIYTPTTTIRLIDGAIHKDVKHGDSVTFMLAYGFWGNSIIYCKGAMCNILYNTTVKWDREPKHTLKTMMGPRRRTRYIDKNELFYYKNGSMYAVEENRGHCTEKEEYGIISNDIEHIRPRWCSVDYYDFRGLQQTLKLEDSDLCPVLITFQHTCRKQLKVCK